jgi:predicted HicB family RNase H-like nuclease
MERPSIHLRLPRDLHDQLRATAEDQDLSLNSLILALLAGSTGWTLDPEADR